MSHMKRLAIDRMNANREATWDWSRFQGSDLMLKFMHRDLPNLEAVIDLVPLRRVAVQAGGAVGIWPKRLAQSFDEVVTCEPDPENFARLIANAPEPNIRQYPVALGARNTTVGICRQRRDGKPKNHEGCVHVSGSGDVPMLTIDEFLLPVCDLIYLDIEGYELAALNGARETLQRCRPVVAAELEDKHLAWYGARAFDVFAFMASVGYVRGPKFGQDYVFLRQDG